MLRSHQANSASPEISIRSHTVSPIANRLDRLDRIGCFLCPEASSSLDCELKGEVSSNITSKFGENISGYSINYNIIKRLEEFFRKTHDCNWLSEFVLFVNKGRLTYENVLKGLAWSLILSKRKPALSSVLMHRRIAFQFSLK